VIIEIYPSEPTILNIWIRSIVNIIKGISNLSIEQMDKLSTKRLLAYKKKLLEAKVYPEDDYMLNCECEDCKIGIEPHEWRMAKIGQIRDILNGRENVK